MLMLGSVSNGNELINSIVNWLGVSQGTDVWLYWFLFCAIVFVFGLVLYLIFIAIYALAAIYLERKVSAWAQARKGPWHVGPHGIFQTVCDAVKLFTKEDTRPNAADKFLFGLAPMLVFIGVIIAFIPLPLSTGFFMADLNIGVFFVLASLSLGTVGVILAGWGSNNKYSLLGAMREAVQMISYEVPLGIFTVMIVAYAGSMSMFDIVSQQTTGWFLFPEGSTTLGFLSWNMFKSPMMFVGFIGFFATVLAATKRSPFDLPESESELVAGFMTEYSGMRWAYFFLAEYAEMFILSIFAAVLFLGGWDIGIPYVQGAINTGLLAAGNGFWAQLLGHLIGFMVVVTKGVLLVMGMMWVRFTLPRIRIDHVVESCWKGLVPISLVLLILNILWIIIPITTFIIFVLAVAGIFSPTIYKKYIKTFLLKIKSSSESKEVV
ncbi:MAG: NADH-quinone oxidoreductase subunit H [Planctomycetes bacterium]|nr:NADH-quinone oxidoreductase subunit H [Planctomycetota bacterium]